MFSQINHIPDSRASRGRHQTSGVSSTERNRDARVVWWRLSSHQRRADAARAWLTVGEDEDEELEGDTAQCSIAGGRDEVLYLDGCCIPAGGVAGRPCEHTGVLYNEEQREQGTSWRERP